MQLQHEQILPNEIHLVKAVLYPFAICDYEGQTNIILKSISYNDLSEGMHIDVINTALDLCQRAGLVDWDEETIGGIRLTEAGLATFMQVRDEFFDADALLSLKERLDKSERALQAEPMEMTVRAKAGDPCPKSGVWQPIEASAREVTYRAGEIMQDLRSPYGFTVWTWLRD